MKLTPRVACELQNAHSGAPILFAWQICSDTAPNRPTWGILIHTVIVHIANHSDDFAPRIVRADMHQFPDGSARRAPVFARKIFRDNHDWTFLKLFLPRNISSGDNRHAHGLKEAWRHKLLHAQGR